MKSLVSANHFELLFNKPSLGASLPSSGWRCFHKPRRPSHSLIFFIQHFPFSIRCNDKTQFQGKLWTILVSSPILTKWRRCHWWWWHPKLRCQPLLLLLDTRLDTRTFYYYSTRTRLEVKNHYSQGPAVHTYNTTQYGAIWRIVPSSAGCVLISDLGGKDDLSTNTFLPFKFQLHSPSSKDGMK